MGAFFNNLHIRKNETADVGSVKNEFTEYLKSKGYQPTENGDDADDTAYIYTSDNSDWITVFSDVLEIGDEQTFAEILHPFSKALNTDALAVACVDSDFLFMNLINDGANLPVFQATACSETADELAKEGELVTVYLKGIS